MTRNVIRDSDLREYAKHIGRETEWELLRSEFDHMTEMGVLQKTLAAYDNYKAEQNGVDISAHAAPTTYDKAPTSKQRSILRSYGIDVGDMSRKIASNVIGDLYARNDGVWSYVQLLPGFHPEFR